MECHKQMNEYMFLEYGVPQAGEARIALEPVTGNSFLRRGKFDMMVY